SGQSPTAVIGTCRAAMRPGGLPFSPDSWTRAQDLTLYRLGQPLRIRGGPIEAVDLTGALILLHVRATMLFLKAENDASRTAPAPIPYWPHARHTASRPARTHKP